MVGIVGVESARSSAGVEAIGVVAGDLVITSVGLVMVRIVGVESAKGLAGVEVIGAVAVDSAKVLIEFIVINWKRGDRLTLIRNESLAY